eukprot:5286572-Prymnesium_polylepis.1
MARAPRAWRLRDWRGHRGRPVSRLTSRVPSGQAHPVQTSETECRDLVCLSWRSLRVPWTWSSR